MIMPYMFDCAYIMQEVLSYPLFLWTVYFLYYVYEKENHTKYNIYPILAALFTVLSIFTKTYMFFIPLVLNICTLIEIVVEKKRKIFFKTMVYDTFCLIFFLGMYFMVYAVNGFKRGSNHYTSQFSLLFPININTILYGIICCVIYAALFMVNTGIIPISALIYQWIYARNRTWMLTFSMLSLTFLIVEIVFMVVLTEEGVGTLPHKFLFRYFQVFVPLIFILFVKYKNDFLFLKSKKVYVTMLASLCISMYYFIKMGGGTRQAIIDGHLFLFIENLAKFILPCADIMIISVFLILIILLMYRYFKKKDVRKFANILVYGGIIGVALFWIVQTIQLPYYTNIITDGKIIQSDGIQISQYLNKEDYDYIYYVYGDMDEENSYYRNFYGYLKYPYQFLSKNDIIEVINKRKGRKIIFISLSNLTTMSSNIKYVNVTTSRLHMFTV